MRLRISLIDREGENDPIEIKVGSKNNGVRDDNSHAQKAHKALLDVLRVMNSPLGSALGATVQGYLALLNAQAQAAAQKEAANESDSRVNQPAD